MEESKDNYELDPWYKWNPGLNNGDLTLREVEETLPGNPPEDIGMVVRLLENPESPLALTGAISLERHDAIHVVLGRGLLSQDEAFVIGFTMGTSKNISIMEKAIFKNVSKYLYPKNFKFNDSDLIAFDLGLETGNQSQTEKIYEFPFEDHRDWKLDDLRKLLNIDIKELKKIYKKEQKLIPGSKESTRLPT
jgi:hypothetical protein